MANFHFRAVSASGEFVEGDIQAVSSEAVVARLREQGHFPLDVGTGSAAAITPSLLSGRSRRGKTSLGALSAMTRELATLIRAGVPLDRGLRFAVEAATEKPLREALERVLARVRSGARLADAVQDQAGVFPSYYSGMLRAGEAGGNLPEVLVELATYLDRLHSLRENLRSALLYPAILAAMTLLTVIVMFAGVLPQFQPLFEDLGDDLPLLTRVFLATGHFVEAWWWAGLLALAAATLFFRYRLRDQAFRRVWDRFKLGMPLIGGLVRSIETVRFARTLSMLLLGGLPLPEALKIVRNALTNTVFRESVDAVAEGLREGGNLTSGIARSGVFPPLAVQLIQVGEEAGRLDGVLSELASSLERETQRTTQRLLAVLVPVVTIFLGGIVALVIISVLGAFLSVNDLAY